MTRGGQDKIARRSGDAPAPLSSAQRRMWFLHHLAGDQPVYNVQRSERLSGPLDVAALEASLNEIVRRHEALRTTFPAVEGNPVPVIAPATSLRLTSVDLQGLPQPQQTDEVQRLAVEEARKPFDMPLGPQAGYLRIDRTYGFGLNMLIDPAGRDPIRRDPSRRRDVSAASRSGQRH